VGFRILGWSFLFAAAFAAGCAVNPAPEEQLAAAHRAIDKAARLELAQQPSPQLSLARDKITLAHRFMEARDYQPARWLAEQSAVDAELAGMKAMSARARKAAAEATAQFRREGAERRAAL
jgi:hypothetical protein